MKSLLKSRLQPRLTALPGNNIGYAPWRQSAESRGRRCRRGETYL